MELQPVFDAPLGSFYMDAAPRSVGALRMSIWYDGTEYPCAFPLQLIYFLGSWEAYKDRLAVLSFHIEELPSGKLGFVMKGGGLIGDTLLWHYRRLPEWLQAQL